MFPKLKNASGTTLAIFSEVNGISVKKNLTSLSWTLTMEVQDNEKSSQIAKNTLIEVDGQDYNIYRKDQVQNESGKKAIKIQAEHTSYDANNYTIDTFASTGTAEQVLNDLITTMGITDFTVGVIATTSVDIFLINQLTSFRRAVSLIANQFGLEVDYDNKVINMPTQVGVNEGSTFQSNKNLKGVNFIEDYVTDQTSIKVDALELQETEEYKTGKLKFVDSVGLGDTVKVITEKINVITRVVEYQYNPLKKYDSKFILSTKLDDYTLQATRERFKQVIQGRAVYGVDINDSDGMVVERTDKQARSIFNADEWKAQVGDGLGNYTDALFFDILAGAYKFVGDVDVTGTITGGNIIGGTITGGTITGASITGNTITGGTISGTSISGGTYSNSFGDTYMDMGITQEIRFARTSDDSGMIINVQGGNVQLFSVDASNTSAQFISSSAGNTIASNIWAFANDTSVLGGLFPGTVATRTWVNAQGFLTGTTGFSGTVSPVNSITVSNGLVTAAS